jgi:GcrA cell cycle regulator
MRESCQTDEFKAKKRARALAGSSWTDERTLILLAAAKTGLSCSEIAKLVGGVSRNAVIGKLHRLGDWPGKPMKDAKEPSPRTKRRHRNRTIESASESAARVGSAAGLIAVRIAKGPKPTADDDQLRDLAPDQSPDAVSLLAIGDKQCRWPLNQSGPGFLFCGSVTRDEACPYCVRHARLAYNPYQRRVEPYVPRRGDGGLRFLGQ